MSADAPKPSDEKNGVTDPVVSGTETLGQGEEDLLEIVPEPKSRLADLIDEMLNRKDELPPKPPEEAILLTHPQGTVSLAPMNPAEREKFEKLEKDKIDLIFWILAKGKIKETRFLEENLLFTVKISKQMQTWASEDSANGKGGMEQKPTVSVKQEMHDLITNLSEGWYVGLKMMGQDLFILGGKNPEPVGDEKRARKKFESIKDVRNFFDESEKIEKKGWGNGTDERE